MFSTREEWLNAAAELMGPLFEGQGVATKPVRISVGFPANKRASGGKTIGECHYMASDSVPQIFIHPALVDGPQGPLPTLAHELAHAYLPGTGHGKLFADTVKKLGLVDKPTATKAGPDFDTDMQAIAELLGDYPHASLDVSKIKKQGTRMIKCECSDCGLVFRTSAKWSVMVDRCPTNDCEGEIQIG